MEARGRTSDTGKRSSELHQEFIEWAFRQRTVGGCLFCPDFQPVGTGYEVKLACEEHRAQEHPELAHKKRRKRAHTNPAIISFRQNLTEEESDAIDDERRRRMRVLGID